MLVAVCPHPPLLVPALDPHGLEELRPVRGAALEVVRDLVAHGPREVVVLASGAGVLDVDQGVGGSLAGHGVDVGVGGAGVDGGATALPLAATVGAWLLDECGWQGPRRYVGPSATEVLREVVSCDDGALLVMADGTACRTERAPGHLDARSEKFDAAVAAALADGDTAALADLDLELASELLMAGGPALVALGEVTTGRPVAARLRHESAPFGVGYWVADWVLE